MRGCDNSAELIFAEAKAHCLEGEIPEATEKFQILMRSNAGSSFRDSILNDSVFDAIRDSQSYKLIMDPTAEKVPPPRTPPSSEAPEEVPSPEPKPAADPPEPDEVP